MIERTRKEHVLDELPIALAIIAVLGLILIAPPYRYATAGVAYVIAILCFAR